MGRALLAVVPLLLGACGPAPLPRSLAGLPLVELAAGPGAQERVRRLHGPGAEVPGRTVVGRYAAPGREVVVYESRFGSGAAARRALERMLAAIARGGSPFAVTATAPGRARLTGLGREHVVGTVGERLVWVEATPGLAERAARELGLSPG